MVQVWCVQIAESALNVSCAVLATRKDTPEDCTSAVPPTVANGDPASTVTVTTPLPREPLTIGSDEPRSPLGDVGEPPQLVSTVAVKPPTAARVATRQAPAQNCRRDWISRMPS